MPPAADIQSYLAGAGRLMLGRDDGMARFDLSADGFWNSFFAMVVAFPAFTVNWVAAANALGEPELGGRFALVLRLAVIDVVAWVLPLLGLALVARQIGIAQRFVAYVVATNWGSALLIWATAPVALARLVFPGVPELTETLSLLVFVVTMVLYWRLTRLSLGLGTGTAATVYFGTLAVSLAIVIGLQSLFGLAPQ
jgi:hypothetical protein